MGVTKIHWAERFDDRGPWASLWLGLSITTGMLLLRFVFDGIFLTTLGFPDGFKPIWQSDIWWPEIVNATLMGYIPAVILIARRGVDRDLIQLRPALSCSDAEFNDIYTAATGPAGLAGRLFMIVGFFAGVHYVFMEPSLYMGSDPPLTNPAFLWALVRIPIFLCLICALIVSENKAVRMYFNMGRNLIDVDLLDVQSLSPFARRGLRSALTWVIFSIIFSLFWLGEGTAARQNPYLLVVVLAMATAAFVIPLIGVHNNITLVKSLELDRLRDKIRVESAVVMDDLSNENPSSPSLANLNAYYQLIDRTREWPIDFLCSGWERVQPHAKTHTYWLLCWQWPRQPLSFR